MKPINMKSVMTARTNHLDVEKRYCSELAWYNNFVKRNSSEEARNIENAKIETARSANDLAELVYREFAASQLGDLLDQVQQRCKARTITPTDIADALGEIEEELRISKKAMDGITVHADLKAQQFPRNYKYIPESTHFTAIYKNGSWRVTDISRARCHDGYKRIWIEHTEASKAALIDRFTQL